MKKKLTLRINESAIAYAKRYAADHETSVSQIVEDFLLFTGTAGLGTGNLPPIHPDVEAITGLLAGSGLDESHYREHLVEKHQ